MSKNYGISEIARELGISRQAVHEKVKKCQSPYLKYPKGRPINKKITPIIKIEVDGWICPFCGHVHVIYKTKKKTEENIKKGFRRTGCYSCLKSSYVSME